MGILLASILALISLILLPGVSFHFDVAPKTIVLLAGVALALVVEFAAPRPKRGSPRTFGLLIGLMALSLAVSSALSDRPALSLAGSSWRQFGAAEQFAVLVFAWLVARHVAGQPGRALPLLRGVSATALVTAVYGIAQYFGWDPLLDRSSYHIGEGLWTIVRPPATFGYVSYFATWLAVAAFLAMLQVQLETSPAWRWIARASAVLSVAGVALSGTRAAMAGVAVGAALGLWVRGWRPGKRALAIGLGIAIAALAFYFSPPGWNLRSRARWFREDPWGGARVLLWRDSVRMAVARPLVGHGPEVFLGVFPGYESPELAAAYPDFAHESPHNILLDAFVAQGIPGLVLTLGFCWVGVAAVRRLAPRRRAAAAAVGAALVAGFVSQQFTAFTMPTALLLFTTLALAVGMCPVPEATPRRWHLAPAMALAAAFVLLAFRVGSADLALADARRAIQHGDLDAASAAFARYRSSGNGAAELWYSRALLDAANRRPHPVERLRWFETGRDAAGRATVTSEDPFNAWYNAAMYASARNDAAATERCLRMSIRSRPNWFKPHWTLAQLLALLSRHEEARREAQLAAELDGGKHAAVVQTRTALLHK